MRPIEMRMVDGVMLLVYLSTVCFVLGFAACRVYDGKRIERVVTEYTLRVQALNDRLMELEK